jgi:hypothetical protein
MWVVYQYIRDRRGGRVTTVAAAVADLVADAPPPAAEAESVPS